MKIRTVIELQDALDSEMAWRKKELSALRSNIQSARKFAQDTALRSGIALLYAHWEGSIKNIAYYYLCYVSNLKIPYNLLKNNFFAISLKSQLNTFEETAKSSLHKKIIDNIFLQYETPSKIPSDGVIKANSNLNSSIFCEILHTIGINEDKYLTSYNLIDEVLLAMRNKIAHGERLDMINLDESRYYEIHEKIFKLIEQFSTDIANAALLKEYLKHPSNHSLTVD